MRAQGVAAATYQPRDKKTTFAATMPAGNKRSGQKLRYQTSQRRFADRTMGEFAGQPNAFWNSGALESGPLTRNFAIGCWSPCTISRCDSGRMVSPRHCPQEMKNA